MTLKAVRFSRRIERLEARTEDEKGRPWAAQGMMPPTNQKSVADFRTTEEELFRIEPRVYHQRNRLSQPVILV